MLQNQTLEEVQKQNQELKELLLKLNQDKQMFEKKVQRKTQELQKLKQSYDNLIDKLMSQKHLIHSQEIEQEQLALQIIDYLIVVMNTQNHQVCNNDSCKVQQQQLMQIQEQQKLDMFYYSKKIKQNEEILSEIKNKYDLQLKDLNEQNTILKQRLEFLLGKTIFYHQAINDLNLQVGDLHQFSIQQSENFKKQEEDSKEKNNQKIIAQLEVRNTYLTEQVRSMESEIIQVEKLVTNIEQLTMQTKKRGK